MNVESVVEKIRKRLHVRMDADKWEEDLHPRDKDGKFKSGSGESSDKNEQSGTEKDEFETITNNNLQKASAEAKRIRESLDKRFGGKLKDARGYAKKGNLTKFGVSKEEEQEIVDQMNREHELTRKINAHVLGIPANKKEPEYKTSADVEREAKKAEENANQLVENGVESCKSSKDVCDYLSTKYGIPVSNYAFENVDVETSKKVATGFNKALDEAPYLKEVIEGIYEHEGGERAVAAYNSSVNCLAINGQYFGKINDLIKQNVESGFWPKNTSVESIIAHECAHAMETWMVNNSDRFVPDDSESNGIRKIDAKKDRIVSKEIVNDALSRISASDYGNGKSYRELKESISQYALKNTSETMAEAFGDCYANGENANPLSKEIKRITLERANEILGKRKGS